MANYKGASTESYRALKLASKRIQEKNEAEHQKKKIGEIMKVKNIDKKFSSQSVESREEQDMKINTVGLVTMAEMQAMQKRMKHAAIERKLKVSDRLTELETKEIEKFAQRKQIKTLSFDINDEDEKGEAANIIPVSKRMRKNPEVDTSFLPDRTRENEEHQLRQDLKNGWIMEQEAIKAEKVDITFSYWDGCGHRFSIQMQKGNTIHEFLHKTLKELLRVEFNELKTVTAEQLMYIKEDLIIPHYFSFYDFIISKARGKSGPLFQFDVSDDVRLRSDATVEKEESHAGKIVLRSWYERNKHIFPASRWEPFNPQKTYDTYSFKDTK
jgi:protein FAM50